MINFILYGDKRATAGLLREYEAENEPIEHVGEILAMVDNRGNIAGKLQVTRNEVLRFIDVPDEFALAEAEGDLCAADFRQSHREYWEREGETITDDTEIVTMYFNLL